MPRRTYYPAVTFDSDLAGLVQLARDSGWTFSNVDLAQLARDVDEQQAERAALAALEAAFLHSRATFARRQEARYWRFASLLATARGAHRHDKAVLAQLSPFTAPRRRAPPKADAMPSHDIAAAPPPQPSDSASEATRQADAGAAGQRQGDEAHGGRVGLQHLALRRQPRGQAMMGVRRHRSSMG